jgi:hypothetical protein
MTEMTEEVTRPKIDAPTPINRMSTQELRSELSRAITMTADALAYLAACWVELERRGEDLSNLRVTLAPYLRAVASGAMAPEAVITFAGKRMVLKWIGKQPIELQRRLAADPRVTIVAAGRERKVPISDLTAQELNLVRSDTMMASEKLPVSRPKRRKKAAAKTIAVLLTEGEFLRIATEANELGRTLSGHMRSMIGLKPVPEAEE